MKKSFTPHITEKSYRLSEKTNEYPQYTFKVANGVDKDELRALVEKEYKVHVTAVQSVHIPGKVRRFKGITGKTSKVNKMIVQLKKGEHIAAFDIDTAKENEKEQSKK